MKLMETITAVALSAAVCLANPFAESGGGYDDDLPDDNDEIDRDVRFRVDNRCIVMKGWNQSATRYLHEPISEAYMFQLGWLGIPHEVYSYAGGGRYLQRPDPFAYHHNTFGNDDGSENPLPVWWRDPSFSLLTGLEHEEGWGRYSCIILLPDCVIQAAEYEIIFDYAEKYGARIVSFKTEVSTYVTGAAATNTGVPMADAAQLKFTDFGKEISGAFDIFHDGTEYEFDISTPDGQYRSPVRVTDDLPEEGERLQDKPRSISVLETPDGVSLMTYHVLRKNVEILGVWTNLPYYQQDAWPLFFTIMDWMLRGHWTGFRRMYLHDSITNYFEFPDVRSPLCVRLAGFCGNGGGRFNIEIGDFDPYLQFPDTNYQCRCAQCFCDTDPDLGVDYTYDDSEKQNQCEPVATFEFNSSYDLIGIDLSMLDSDACTKFYFSVTGDLTELTFTDDSNGGATVDGIEYGIDRNYEFPVSAGSGHISFAEDGPVFNYRNNTLRRPVIPRTCNMHFDEDGDCPDGYERDTDKDETVCSDTCPDVCCKEVTTTTTTTSTNTQPDPTSTSTSTGTDSGTDDEPADDEEDGDSDGSTGDGGGAAGVSASQSLILATVLAAVVALVA
eukprot:Clim_evm67s218 gene=Clim_evmTU67s218